MRTKTTKDKYLENNIKYLYNLIKKAPVLEEEIILYRFLHDDSFLKEEFIEEGFMSTTRDPFYKSPFYSLGNKLMKIRIKKNSIYNKPQHIFPKWWVLVPTIVVPR
jgi:hypothetical protein